MSKACDCVKAVNEKLKPFGGEVQVNLWGVPRTFVCTYQEPVKGARRKKMPLVAATFCPFCGTAYPESNAMEDK